MPSRTERDYMQAHINRHGLAVVPAAGGLPLITYGGPPDGDGLHAHATTGQHIRAACLGLRHGIGPEGWGARLLNLAHLPDEEALLDGDWQAGWNGVWIHQSHGVEGLAGIPRLVSGRGLYQAAGRHVFNRPGFRHALIKTCHAAGGLPVGSSVIETLAAAAHESLQLRPRLYGARAVTWVPITGPYYGMPLIGLAALFPVLSGPDDPNGDPDDATASREDEMLQLAIARYFAGPEEVLVEFSKDPVRRLDLVADYVTEAFIDNARFEEDLAVHLPLNIEQRRELGDSGADPNWYGVNL